MNLSPVSFMIIIIIFCTVEEVYGAIGHVGSVALLQFALLLICFDSAHTSVPIF